jgi:Stress responsive A/B Barrel Domain
MCVKVVIHRTSGEFGLLWSLHSVGVSAMPTVQHMVVVKFKPDVSEKAIAQLLDDLRVFWSKTAGITYYAAGSYSSPEGLNQGYTHGFLVTFDNPAARDAYLRDPEHEKVVTRVLPMLDGLLAFDFEVP